VHDGPCGAGKLVTVFSAPDYPQFQAQEERFNNQASVIRLLPPSYAEYEVVTFGAAPRPPGECFYDLEIPGSDDEMHPPGDEASDATDAIASSVDCDAEDEAVDRPTGAQMHLSPQTDAEPDRCGALRDFAAVHPGMMPTAIDSAVLPTAPCPVQTDSRMENMAEACGQGTEAASRSAQVQAGAPQCANRGAEAQAGISNCGAAQECTEAQRKGTEPLEAARCCKEDDMATPSASIQSGRTAGPYITQA
jgi:hypothetical protein